MDLAGHHDDRSHADQCLCKCNRSTHRGCLPKRCRKKKCSYAGETVTIFTAAGEDQAKAFQDEFVDFIAETGIEVVVEGSPDFEVLSVTRAEAGDPPEIYNFPQPGLMADMARDGYLIDLNEALGADYLGRGIQPGLA